MNTVHLQLDIDGMSCGSCVSHVRSALASLPGVHVDDVRIGRALVTGPSSLPEAQIRGVIAAAGYTLTHVEQAQEGASEARRIAPHAAGGCCCSGDAEQTAPQLARRRPR